jgi:DNA-binding MarR family transcriptional regulator
MTETFDSRAERIKHISGTFITLMWIAKRRFFQLLGPFGLTAPQFISLAALSMHQEPCKMSDLTGITLHDAATMTGIIDRLVHMELVHRSHSHTDRRVVLVQITQAGLNLVKQIQDELLKNSLTVYEILTDEELAEIERVFSHVLRRVVKDLSAAGANLDTTFSSLESFMCEPGPWPVRDAANQRLGLQQT